MRTYACEICGGLDDLVALARQRLELTERSLKPAQRVRYLAQ